MQAFYQAELRPDLVDARLGRFEASRATREAILAVRGRFATAMFPSMKIHYETAHRTSRLSKRFQDGESPAVGSQTLQKSRLISSAMISKPSCTMGMG